VLRKFLQSQGLSQTQFSRVVRVSARTVRAWCSGESPISFEKIGSSQLWRAFFLCVLSEERKAGRL
jgi:transcriptional regulator with XRE-family HTH domain